MLTFLDIQISIVYLLLVYIAAVRIKHKKIHKIPLYKYYVSGMMVRVFGGIMVCLIYLFYYKGGDTTNYYKGSVCMINLMFENFSAYLDIMMGDLSFENYLLFNKETGYPPTYMYRDEKTFSVIRYANLLVLLCMKSFVPTTIVLSALAFSGPWRLFLMFCREFPGLSKQLAVAILFVPSVFFWGSGLLKDTFTFSAICWYSFSFYKTFIVKEQRIKHLIFVIISLWLLISIKPYLFIAVFPGSVLWFVFHFFRNVKNSIAKLIYFPIITTGGLIIAFALISMLGERMGKYRLDNIMDVAIITQDDLSRDTYGPNSFDVGAIDGTAIGMLKKMPIAITATFFRPFIWEIKNPVMFLSGLENTIILVLTIMMFVKIKPMAIFNIITGQPILLFSLLFSLILGFSIGVSTANFGALVRYKIPVIPFFLSSVLIIQYYYKYGDTKEISKELKVN